MQMEKLDSRFYVSPQISVDDIASIAAEGIKSIINNRPDGEAVDQPLSKELASAAAAFDIPLLHLPVVSGSITESEINAFKRMCDEIEGPVLLFCRSGARCRELLGKSQLV